MKRVGLEIEHYCSLLPPLFDGRRIVFFHMHNDPPTAAEHNPGEIGEWEIDGATLPRSPVHKRNQQ